MEYCIMCRYYNGGFCYNFNIFADPNNSCDYIDLIINYNKPEVEKNVGY